MSNMQRRSLSRLLGGAAAALAARGGGGSAAGGQLPTSGLARLRLPPQGEWVAAFVRRLRELGWIEGHNLAIEYRWAERGAVSAFAEIAANWFRLQGRCHSQETRPMNGGERTQQPVQFQNSPVSCGARTAAGGKPLTGSPPTKKKGALSIARGPQAVRRRASWWRGTGQYRHGERTKGSDCRAGRKFGTLLKCSAPD